MKSSTQRRIGVVLSYVVICLNIIVSICYTPFLTSKLGQSEYGLYTMVSSIIAYLTVLDFGFSNAIIIYSSKYRKKKEESKESNLYGLFFVIYSIIGILVGLIGLVLYFNVENLFSNSLSINELVTAKKLMFVLVVNLIITFPFSVFGSIVNSYEKFIFSKIINIISIILRPVIMIPLLFYGYKSLTLTIVITLINVLSLFLNMFYCYYKLKIKVKFNNMNFKLLPEIFVFSFWIFLNNIIDKINWNLDNFLLGMYSGTVSVSIYAIASQINQLYISFSTAITSVILPKIANMAQSKKSNNEFNSFFIKCGRIQMMVVGLILSGFIIFGKKFILLWVGEKYIQSYYIAIVLMAPMVVSLIQNSATSIVQVKNKHKFMPIVLLGTSILNIIISIPLIKLYNGLGAAIGTGVSLLIGNIIIKNIYYHKVVKLDIINFIKNVFSFFVFMILLTLFGYLIFSYIKITGWLSLLFSISIYCIIYCSGVYFLLNNYEKNLIFRLFNKFLRR